MLFLLFLGCTLDWRTEAPEPSLDPIVGLEALGYVATADVQDPGEGVETLDPRAQDGTNLIVSAHGFEVLLTDLEGQTLHRWSLSPEAHGSSPERRFFRRAFLQDDGSLLTHIEYHSLWRLSAEGQVLWHVEDQNHHHLEVNNQHIYSLTSRLTTPPWWTGEEVTEEFVTIYDLSGTKLEDISILEAVARSGPTALVEAARREGDDPLHINSLTRLDGRVPHPAFAAGNLLLSSRKQSRILVLDPKTGTIVWTTDGAFHAQHEAQVLPTGNLLLFDNGHRRRGSAAKEFTLPAMELVWSWSGGGAHLYSGCCGTVKRLKNGNTMVVSTTQGWASEVTTSGDTVWSYRTPFRTPDGTVAKLFDVVRTPPTTELGWLSDGPPTSP